MSGPHVRDYHFLLDEQSELVFDGSHHDRTSAAVATGPTFYSEMAAANARIQLLHSPDHYAGRGGRIATL
jgi:hypothetical protein